MIAVALIKCRAEEVMAPWFLFKKHGYEVVVASVKGGEVPFDEASLNPPFATKEVEQGILDGEQLCKRCHHNACMTSACFSLGNP